MAALTNLDRVSILAEALPYMQRFAGKTIVVKYGGAAMKDPTLKVAHGNATEGIRCVGVGLGWGRAGLGLVGFLRYSSAAMKGPALMGCDMGLGAGGASVFVWLC